MEEVDTNIERFIVRSPNQVLLEGKASILLLDVIASPLQAC